MKTVYRKKKTRVSLKAIILVAWVILLSVLVVIVIVYYWLSYYRQLHQSLTGQTP